MKKILVTHINPHLDDIAAIWLFKKFHPEYQDAEIKFISASVNGATLDGKPVDNDPNILHFGVGRGKYDEHKGDVGECATSLVWKEVVEQGLVPQDEIEKQAYEELTAWNTLIDTAKLPQFPYEGFSVPSFIRPLSGKDEDSLEAVILGEKILDRILQVLINKNKVEKDWENRVEFDTKWGKAVAIASDDASRVIVRGLVYDQGLDYALFLMMRPKSKSAEYFTDKDEVELTELEQKVRQLEPEATWYLHHSKKMLLCGAKAAPGGVPSNLTLEQLIAAVQSL